MGNKSFENVAKFKCVGLKVNKDFELIKRIFPLHISLTILQPMRLLYFVLLNVLGLSLKHIVK
jgi:hypothetical protein